MEALTGSPKHRATRESSFIAKYRTEHSFVSQLFWLFQYFITVSINKYYWGKYKKVNKDPYVI